MVLVVPSSVIGKTVQSHYIFVFFCSLFYKKITPPPDKKKMEVI